MHLQARHFRTGELVQIQCDAGCIQAIGPPSGPADRHARWVSPGLFDLQINGAHGISFTSPRLTPEEVRRVVDHCRQHGIAELCPTVTTEAFDVLVHGLATIRSACEQDSAIRSAVAGVHLEGPYLSPEDGPRGAHPRDHIRPPSWDEFRQLQQAAGGRIRLVTVAPEQPGALAFIERLTADKVVVAIGHTAASARCIRDAISAGARLSTHLGNGCHLLLHRHNNYVWEQLAADELWASLICDGQHLPPAMIRCFLRVKTPARVILTCDASSLAGVPPGRYHDLGQEVEVLPEGRIVTGTGLLAGSWSFTDRCVDEVMRWGNVGLADAIDMACKRPRELLGLPPRDLRVGDPADLLLFDYEIGGSFQVRELV